MDRKKSIDKNRNQGSIGITAKEKRTLEHRKSLYEKYVGGKVHWGNFLSAISLLGLTELGIFEIVKTTREGPAIECLNCNKAFSIANIDELPAMNYITCPNCEYKFVIFFDMN